jgi:hypothetical protein
MNYTKSWRGLAAALAVLGAGCSGDLDVENPNAPDAARAFSDPATIGAVAGGTIRTWLITRQDYNSGLLINAMADGFTASWNNFNLRYYTSEGNECPVRCGWANVLTSAQYIQLETFWYGYYSALSSANDALTAIRTNGVTITNAATTKMIETISVMMQGIVFANIALNYDQGFIVTEETDLSDPLGLELHTAAEMQAAAIEKLDEAYALAQANVFTTNPNWTGLAQGTAYTNVQIAKLIRTMQAEVVAHFARNAAQDAAVTTAQWGQVAQWAAQGVSAAPGFDFGFFQDGTVWWDGTRNWGNDITTVRVDTRLAAVITAGPDPAKVHVTPWPSPNGNPQPDAYDHRVGDGTWGPEDDFNGGGTLAEDEGHGTDFAWAGSNPYPAARGLYHYSNLGHIRYSYLAYAGYGLPDEDGTGPAPVYTQTFNDLLWAEGLIRGGGDKAQAAALINKTRVDRGHLTPLTGGESDAALLEALRYEQDIELLGIGGTIYYNHRRIDKLAAMTPRQMPIPAKELGLLAMELYSFGGPNNPGGVSAGVTSRPAGVRSVKDIWADLEKASRAEARSRIRR